MEINSVTNENFQYLLRLYQVVKYYENHSRKLHQRNGQLFTTKLFLTQQTFLNDASKNEKICLTLDCRGINQNGPGMFHIEADSLEEQSCYFDIENNNRLFNVFLTKRIRNSKRPTDAIRFQIKRVKGRTKNTNETFDATSELDNLISNDTRISAKVISNTRKRKPVIPIFFFCTFTTN